MAHLRLSITVTLRLILILALKFYQQKNLFLNYETAKVMSFLLKRHQVKLKKIKKHGKIQISYYTFPEHEKSNKGLKKGNQGKLLPKF